MSSESNNKKGNYRRIFKRSPSSTTLASQSATANPEYGASLDYVQQDRRQSLVGRILKGKKQGTSSRTDLNSTQVAVSDSLDSDPSIATFQRSSLNLQATPFVDDQVSSSAVHHHIAQDGAGNDTSANQAQAVSPVEQDLHDASVQSVPTILIDELGPQGSLEAAPPVLTTPPAHRDVHHTVIQSGNTVATVPTSPETALVGDQLLSDPAGPKTASAKDNLKVAGRFLQTVISRIPDVIDSNPVKMAFSIAKVVIDIKNNVVGNMDTVERKIVSVAEQLEIMESALGRWEPKRREEKLCLERLKIVFQREMENLVRLNAESLLKKIIDYEDQKSRIADIFERVNEARIQFGLATDLRIFKAIHAIQEIHKRTLLKDLEPSRLADHKYNLEGEKREILRRAVCTPGTRERLLNNIITWASGTSSETIYWLFGRAGTGKTTIAFTIARWFEMATAQDVICLGGNFFSSRQFEETRKASCIIRTIVYHLALRCKPFADALMESGDFDTVDQNVRAQFDGLLIGPWQKSEQARLASSSPCHLIVIDALDEIEGTGGSNFLRDLLDTINRNHLSGLKFFVTSRPDPKIEAHVATFADRQQYRLEEVPFDEVEADIKMYLDANVPDADAKYINAVVTSAAGLFIYASTIVRYVKEFTPGEQNQVLEKFFGVSEAGKMSLSMTSPLDTLYRTILQEAFAGFEGDLFQHRLDILFTMLCASKRVSTSIVTQLLSRQRLDFAAEIGSSLDTSIADNVLKHLHAVLYVEDDKVLWHHKSFPDFLFDQERSIDFWCDQAKHHQLLLKACFIVMKKGLQFNIAGIQSSFVFDSDNTVLPQSITKSISPSLSYACQKWNAHFFFIKSLESGIAIFCQIMKDFLQLQVLFWIEVMNLLKVSGQCGPMLKQVALQIKKYNPELAQQLVEAANFAIYFSGSPSTLCTPQLYLSSLSTWPRDLDPCGLWKNLFPGIPKFRSRSYHNGVSLCIIKAKSHIRSVAFSPDGTSVVSGSDDGPVSVWDTSTGQQINIFQGHTSSVFSVAFSSNGTYIVSGSHDMSVRIWDVSTGHQIKILQGHTHWVESVAFSPNGRHIVSGSDDKSVRVWDASTGQQINVLQGHKSTVNSVAFSPDGIHIVSGSGDKSVRVWDASTGQKIKWLQGHENSVMSVAFAPNNTHIVSGCYDRSVRIWDVSTGHQINILQGHTEWVKSVAFSPDGTHIVSGSGDKSVRVWDASTGQEINVLQGHTNWVESVAFSPDGTNIVSGSNDNSIRVWDASTGPANNMFHGHTSPVNSVAFSPDSKYIVSGSDDKSVKVWDASSGQEINALQGHTNSVNSAVFSPDGTHIVSGSDDKLVRVWDTSTGLQINELQGHTNWVKSVAFSLNGKQIISSARDKSVKVWDVSTGHQINTLQGHTNWVRSVAFSPDSKYIVSGSSDRSVRVWDASTGHQINVLQGHKDWVNCVAFSPDGTYIISGSDDKSVQMRNASTGQQIKVLQGHKNTVNSVAFSPDGTYIVSGSHDNTVRIWNASTGNQINILHGHTDPVSSVAFSPDGAHIVSGSYDKSVRVWNASIGHQINVKPQYIREQAEHSTHREKLWTIYTGWLLSPDGASHLMFVPLDALLPDASNILTIPQSTSSSLDLTNTFFGPQWSECYKA